MYAVNIFTLVYQIQYKEFISDGILSVTFILKLPYIKTYFHMFRSVALGLQGKTKDIVKAHEDVNRTIKELQNCRDNIV